MINDWKKFLLVNSHKKFIKIFIDTFLGIYLLRIDNGSVTNVCLYYIIYCIFNIIFFNLVNKFRKISLMNILRIGIFFSLVECLLLIILGFNISKYIIPFAIFTSFVNALYYYPQPLITNALTNKNNKNKYCTWDRIINDSIGVLFPIIFGFIISVKSYRYIFIILTIISLIAFAYSFFIKTKNINCERINLKNMFKSLEKHNSMRVIKLMSIRTLFRGLSSFGVLSTLMTLLAFITLKTESKLGNLTGIITFIGIISLYLFSKKIPRKKQIKYYIPLSIIHSIITFILTISIILIPNNNLVFGISINLIVVLLYNLLNGIINPIFEVANETVYYENISSEIIDSSLNSSYTYYFEILINLSRIIGYIALYLVSLIGFNVINICIMILVLSLMYIAFAVTLNKLNSNIK